MLLYVCRAYALTVKQSYNVVMWNKYGETKKECEMTRGKGENRRLYAVVAKYPDTTNMLYLLLRIGTY
ncbi:hypothetical protein LA52FAK_43320 [Desulforhopalus sp. 52FAK]